MNTNQTTHADDEPITVTFKDGRPPESVLVQTLQVASYPKYVASANDESRQVELLTGKDSKWVDCLSRASFEQIITTGDKLNLDFFRAWQQRRFEKMEASAPGTMKLMQEQVMQAMRNSMPQVGARAADSQN